MRRYVAGILALALLLLVSVTLKFANTLAATQPDIQRMRIDIANALEIDGYAATLASGTPAWWTEGLVSGRIGPCTANLRDATYFAPELEAISSQRMNGGRALRYYWGDKYIASYPRVWIEVQWRVQREMARLGWRYGIKPVIAVGASGDCWPDPRILKTIRIYYQNEIVRRASPSTATESLW